MRCMIPQKVSKLDTMIDLAAFATVPSSGRIAMTPFQTAMKGGDDVGQ